jgi:hypothetical protein
LEAFRAIKARMAADRYSQPDGERPNRLRGIGADDKS